MTFSSGIEGYVFSVYGPAAPWNWNAQTTTDANGDGTLSILAGTYEYAYGAPDTSGQVEGSFTIVACPPPPSWGLTTTCAVAGSAQGGSLIITFLNGAPDTVVVDGNVVDVTSIPFTYGPLTVGNHSVTLEGFPAPFTISACAVPPPPVPGTAAGLG